MEEHILKLQRYQKNGYEYKKKNLALKVVNSFDDEGDEFEEAESKYEEYEITLLGKKFGGFLKNKETEEKENLFLKDNNKLKITKEVHSTLFQLILNAKNLDISNQIVQFT